MVKCYNFSLQTCFSVSILGIFKLRLIDTVIEGNASTGCSSKSIAVVMLSRILAIWTHCSVTTDYHNITIIESVTQIHLFGIPSFILFDRIALSFLTAFVIMDISPLFCCLSCIVLFSIK